MDNGANGDGLMNKLLESKFTYQSYGLTNRGCVRDHNEDAFLDSSDKGFWVVADGAGGHESGEVASKLIVDTLSRIERDRFFGSFVQKVTNNLQDVNHQLIDKSGGEETKTLIASTVCILIAQRSNVICLWSGDSRIYQQRGHKLTQLTRDHNRVDEFIEAGFTRDDAEKHPQAQYLTAAIGVTYPLFTETQRIEVMSEDIYLLCSDGLFKEVSDEEIEEILQQTSLKYAASDLMDLSLSRGATDNVTILLVQVSNISR
jgi:serine/threonine protein phosphatase PrpC